MGLMDKLKGMMGGKKADTAEEEAAERLRQRAIEEAPPPPPRPAPTPTPQAAAPAADPLEAMMPATDPLEELRKAFRENNQDAECGIKLA
ncbi:MAG: hypothetical protein ACYCW6_27825, partial [Candidatus Xenobia bacterium]